MITTWGSRNLTILKHYWSTREERFLTLSEVLDTPALGMYNYKDIVEAGVKVVDNSPEEILAAVREMEQRLDGTWRSTPEDEALQERFWEKYRRRYPERVYVARVGTQFLRDAPHWLD
jgi:putative glycosyltransferase (TIGR04372 family)